MPTIQNDLLSIDIKTVGAELCKISAINNNNQFLWHADPNVWGSHAPNLFPIIGSMKDDSYIYKNKLYNMTKHGFVRHNDKMIVKQQSETSITFFLNSNEDLYEIFPFLFEFEINYELKDNTIIVNHTIRNIDDKTMYFSLGGHPAFTCPLFEDDAYSDYFLEFEKEETSESYLLNMKTGLVTNKTKSVFDSPNTINLRGDLFNEDALIFKDLKSRKVALKHKTNGEILSVIFEDFPYLGIWAKPNAPYVCIEPWLGVADTEDTNQKIEEKEGIVTLKPKKSLEASYKIILNRNLLN
ncbi:aldose 1-epimerase family protein [Winogradskyella poriferorum]|uniref:Aldose 1-epimerase family protein n=1 Tax=Winogradskyella poriferorum TaxID=307627 RepID=A0ABU7W5V8_9FLAO